MSRKKSKNKKSNVKMLPISIIIFIVLAILALIIILNKGNIAGYSLVKIGTSTDSAKSGQSVDNKEDVLEIALEQKYLSSTNKETQKVTVLLNNEEIDISEVELESSNEDLLKVLDDGSIKAVSNGKVTITAKKDDLTATADLRVITPIKSITFTATSSVIRVGKSLQMKLVATPSDASIETLKYESSDEEIATVNSNGIVTGVAPGSVTITVKDLYNDNIEKSVKLTIKK